MQSAVAQKPENTKSNDSDSASVNNVKHETNHELGAEAGMPIFLQRAPDSVLSSQPNIIESQVAGDKLPTEAEKAIALAAAKVAELLATQAAATGKNEIAKSKTDELAEQEAGKVAKEEVALAEGATDAVSTEALPGEEGAQDEAPAEQEKGKEQTTANAAKAGAGATEEASASDKAPTSAREDPAFKAVLGKVKRVASQQRAHDPAKIKAEQAQSAAESPQTELEGKAQDTQIGVMEQAETPAFDAVAFKAQLMDRIKALAPKTVKEADDFKKNDKLGALKGDMQNSVAEQKTVSQAPMAEQTAAPPDVAGAEAKPVTPLTLANPGLPPVSVGAQQAAPKSKGQSELETPLGGASAQVDSKMLEADVDEEQLKKANEPEFQGAVDAKSEVSVHAKQGPMQYREFEQGQISQAEQVAAATATERTQGMHAERGGLLKQVEGQQGQAKSKDELARDKIAGDISKIYEKTKTNVETRLSELDGKVAKVFDVGAGAAKQAFEDYVEAKMEAYKEERYGGFFGWARWGKDKLLGMPPAVNTFYTEGRQLYLDKMDAVIDNVVALVGTELTEAKADIATGKQEIKDYVTQLPDDLKTVGEEASTEIADKFDELEQSIDDKQNALIESLANKYQDNLKAVDARIDELKAANQGLVDKAMNAVVGVIKIILKLKDMLTTVLAKIAAVVGKIIKDPIGFLGNLISGLMQGFVNFKDNIGTHLQKGLIGWLTGALGPVGIQIPDDLFSLKGIFSLVSQVLGITWGYVRKKASELLGEPVVKGLETAFTPFKILSTEGPAGLWEFVKDEFNDLKEMVMDKIKEMVITEVIKAGVKWILGMLNPASAFIKAAMAIYDIVMFFINQGSRILELVNSIIDAVGAIANGAIGGAAKMVENALAKALPIVIGFLANLLGIGGLAKKVQDLIKRIRKRIDKAIDKLILKAKKFGRTVLGKVSGKPTPAGKINKAQRAASEAVHKRLGSGEEEAEVQRILFQIQRDLAPIGLKSLELGSVEKDGSRPIYAEASPKKIINKLVDKNIIVALQASITLAEVPDKLEGRTTEGEALKFGFAEIMEEGRLVGEAPGATARRRLFEGLGGTGKEAQLPAVSQQARGRGFQPSAGVILEPRPGESLTVLAWNTSQPKRDDNVSHAETQFVEWFERHPRKWFERVRSVEVVVEGRPICSRCLETLKGARQQFLSLRSYPNQSFTWREINFKEKVKKVLER